MKISDKQYKTLAELYYLNVMEAAYGPWDKLLEEARDKYLAETKIFVECIEKIGLMVIPEGQEVRPRREVEIGQVEHVIKEFITKNIKKPAGILNIFPYQELARIIVNEFKIG